MATVSYILWIVCRESLEQLHAMATVSYTYMKSQALEVYHTVDVALSIFNIF